MTRILVVEDNASCRCALSAVLVMKGHGIIEAKDGLEAWEIMQQPAPPELLILDLIFPELDGLNLLRRIRATIKCPIPYVIVLSEKGAKEEIIAGLDAGADDYLPKPFDSPELIARINVGRRKFKIREQCAGQVRELRLRGNSTDLFILQEDSR